MKQRERQVASKVEAERPRVSVIIPVFEDRLGLARCLERLAEQTYPLEKTEILVIDNGSRKGYDDLLETRRNVRLLRESQVGSYAARNLGLTQATAEFLAFTDADCLPAPDWLERGVDRLLAEEGAGLVGGEIDLEFEDPHRPTVYEIFDQIYSFRQQLYVERRRFAATANMFTRCEVIRRVGNFNAGLRSGGDSEWGKRVHAAGFRLVYAPEVRVLHPARKTFAEIFRKQRRLMGGAAARERRGSLLLKTPFVEILESLYFTRQVLAAQKFPLSRRVQAAGLRYFMAFLRAAEKIRLAAGGEPQR